MIGARSVGTWGNTVKHSPVKKYGRSMTVDLGIPDAAERGELERILQMSFAMPQIRFETLALAKSLASKVA
jgi:hypothetical protein